MPDRAQDTEAIRAIELDLPAMRDFANEMRAGTGDDLGPMFFRDVARLVARLEAAEQALVKYGAHSARCLSYRHDFRVRFRDAEPTCLCGFAAALAAAAPGETEQTP